MTCSRARHRARQLVAFTSHRLIFDAIDASFTGVTVIASLSLPASFAGSIQRVEWRRNQR